MFRSLISDLSQPGIVISCIAWLTGLVALIVRIAL